MNRRDTALIAHLDAIEARWTGQFAQYHAEILHRLGRIDDQLVAIREDIAGIKLDVALHGDQTAWTGRIMNKILAYIRVSTETQLDGYGLDIQTANVNTLAIMEGLTAPFVYSDAGISGTKEQADRPGLDALIVHCQDNEGCTVILPKLDRLARSLAIQETLLAVLWQTGATVLSCDPAELHYLRTGDDPDDPTRTLIRQVLGAVAQFERGQIRLRLRAGRRRKIAAVGWAGGTEPYGWTNEDEQDVLNLVDLWRANKVAWRTIVTRLTNDGKVKRNGKPWNETELCQVYRSWTKRPVAS